MSTALRLLLVEDVEDDVELVVRLLRRAGRKVTFERVDTAEAFGAALARAPWDVVVADYMVPGFDAPQALELLQRSGLDVPFIIVSGAVGEEMAVAAMKAGAQDYISKAKLGRLVPAIDREIREVAHRRARHRAEGALREAEERVRSVVEHAPIVLFATDKEGTFTLSEGRGLRALGLRPGEAIGRTAFDVYHGAPWILDDLGRALGGEEFTGGGAVAGLWHETRYWPQRGADGKVEGVIGVATDITDRRKAEEERDELLASERIARAAAEEAVRARDDFLSIASHELRTPLTSLQLAVQSLLHLARSAPSGPPPAQLTGTLHVVERQGRRLTQLVDALLDVARIEGGRLDLCLQDVDLAATARDVALLFGPDLERAGCRLSLRADHAVLGRWDSRCLDQILSNLLSNAVRYGAGKPIEMEVGATDGTARLVVQDHGIGIPSEAQARIFDRFERAVSPSHYGGLGLGLFIVSRVLDALGGSIRVESLPGAGATFTVSLPRAGPPAA